MLEERVNAILYYIFGFSILQSGWETKCQVVQHLCLVPFSHSDIWWRQSPLSFRVSQPTPNTANTFPRCNTTWAAKPDHHSSTQLGERSQAAPPTKVLDLMLHGGSERADHHWWTTL